MRFNLPACRSKMASIGEIVLGRRLEDDEHTAQAGIEKLTEFFKNLDITTALQPIVVDADALPQVCKMATQDACLITNPREATWEDILHVCEACW